MRSRMIAFGFIDDQARCATATSPSSRSVKPWACL
jgi:hypothetical protein